MLPMEFCSAFVQLYGREHCLMNLHLHGHIATCIRDYGLVYAFWCFGFERLNGILGSYHVNNRNISIQIANRFLYGKAHAPTNWPAEFRQEYLPMIERFSYNKGSLTQINIVIHATCSVTALPPVTESSFMMWECDDLKPNFNTILEPDSFDILILHKRARALVVGQFVIGAKKTKHSRSCLVLAEQTHNSDSSHHNYLSKIRFFVGAVAVSKVDHTKTHSMWCAAVSWFMEHQCKVWFGSPAQVWSTATYPGYSYIPVPDIKSYSKSVVYFSRLIGTATVYIITPLDAQCA